MTRETLTRAELPSPCKVPFAMKGNAVTGPGDWDMDVSEDEHNAGCVIAVPVRHRALWPVVY